MILQRSFRRAFLRRLIATAAGRAHVLNLVMNAEEGDEAGVFDRLQRLVDDPPVRQTIARHQADEREHASLYRACLERNGVRPEPVPPELMIVRRVAAVAGGAFAAGARTQSAESMETRADVMNTYALLLAIEERGVRQFPMFGREFRRIGDHQTAHTFDRVTKDEMRHVRYCRAIGRRYAPDDAAWERAVSRCRAVENRAFRQVSLAGMAYAIERGLVWSGPPARFAAALIRRFDSMPRA